MSESKTKHQWAKSTIKLDDGGVIRFDIATTKYTNGMTVVITAKKIYGQVETAQAFLGRKFYNTGFEDLASMWITQRIDAFKRSFKMIHA